MQDPRQISLDLDAIASLLEFAGASKFRVNAYRRGAEIVNTLGDELGSLVEQGRLQDFEGIGPALSKQIEEQWNTGSSELLARLLAEQPEGVLELMQIPGLTPRRIHALHAALGIRSALELRDACAAGRVRTVAGFGPKTEERLREAVDAWLTRDEKPPDPLPLADALALAEAIRARLVGAVEAVELAGALRRREELVRELEFVVTGDPERAFDALATLRQVLRIERAERRALLTDRVTLLLHFAERVNAGGALVEATGNAAHVAALQARAVERGVDLKRDFAGERELYATVGCAFVPPELRTGGDELTQAAEHDFSDLIDEACVVGMVHCHTTYSDGKNSVLEMAQAAHARGMQYITITDHSPSAFYARGVALDRLKEQWDEIAAAREAVPIRILAGTESDILADGALDYPDAVLERFDVVIASIHARHRMDRAAMTARLLRAMSQPVFKIWGHALGRILNHRAPIDCDVPAVLDALAKAGGAVEINADPHRLDLPPSWMPEVRARKLPFVISVDAHSTRGLDVLRYGVAMARRGGVRKGEVLNAAPAEVFAASVKPV